MADARQIDPISQALGHIEGRMDGIDKRLDTIERTLLWGFGLNITITLAGLSYLAMRLPR